MEVSGRFFALRGNGLAERREQILEGFSRCLSEQGLEGTTLDAVAAKAGVQRAAIRHFVGNRNELIRAGVEHIAARYARTLERELKTDPGADRLVALLDSLFLGHFATGHAEEDRALGAMMAAAASDEQVRESLRDLYALFERRLARELRAARPDAAPEHIVEIAYAILCLSEQNSTMQSLGFPTERARAARAAAATLVDTLRS